MRNLFERIFQEREGRRQADGSFMCLCPSHDDHDPSLHVSLINDKILVHCKVGCSQKDIVTALRTLNLWTSLESHIEPKLRRTNPAQSTATKKPLPTIPPGIFKTRKEKTLSNFWTYKDQAGKVLGHVARYDGNGKKEIIPYFNYKNSQWSPGAPQTPRPLYGLNHITRASKDLTIWIVEGEKCAEALQSLPPGVRRLATTSMGGTNAARLTDWSPLAGRNVRIWPDYDKAGKVYAENVKLQLEGLMPPPTIEMVNVPKLGLKEKEDVFDWLQTHKPDELDKIPIENKKGLKKTCIKGLLETDFKPEELILSPWLPTQGLGMIHARPGVGKTFLAIGIAFAVAAGGKFLKWEAPQARSVLYIDGEMAGDDIKKRYEKIVVEHGFALPSKSLEIITPDINEDILPDIGTKSGQKIVEGQITDECELIILDNLSCLQRTGIENDASGWTVMQEWLLHLKSMGKAVLLIHHSGKGFAQRGTSKREDFLNTILTLKRNPLYEFEEGACFEVHYEKARSVYGPAARPFEAKLDIGEGVWTIRDLKMVTYDQVVKMMREDYKQIEIAQSLGKSRAAISQHVKRAKEKGDL
ncbi:AAA family ATPase [candidate division WOR-3 bacterium]|nr:AAA family ATPase [candidate division WOR-3 bacterium]